MNTLKTHYFKTIGQQMGNGKVALIMVVDENTISDTPLPTIFEMQGAILPKTIYTGTNPKIQLIPDTLVDREDEKGSGLASLFVNTNWFNVTQETKDSMGVSIEKK